MWSAAARRRLVSGLRSCAASRRLMGALPGRRAAPRVGPAWPSESRGDAPKTRPDACTTSSISCRARRSSGGSARSRLSRSWWRCSPFRRCSSDVRGSPAPRWRGSSRCSRFPPSAWSGGGPSAARASSASEGSGSPARAHSPSATALRTPKQGPPSKGWCRRGPSATLSSRARATTSSCSSTGRAHSRRWSARSRPPSARST